MNPILVEALVGPRQDDLRRSARQAGGAGLRSRSAAPAHPLPAWAAAIRRQPVAALVAEPCAAVES